MANSLVVFDTSIFIDNLQLGLHRERIAAVTGLIRNSAVVMAELWRGATKKNEHAFLRAMERNHPILGPTERNWIESGQILGSIHADKGFEPRKLRDLHFDVLIALTVRAHGARLITSNRADCELIARYRPFEYEVW